MPLFYLFGLEELEPRSPGEALFLGLLRCLLDGMLAALVGSSLLLWVVTWQGWGSSGAGRSWCSGSRSSMIAPRSLRAGGVSRVAARRGSGRPDVTQGGDGGATISETCVGRGRRGSGNAMVSPLVAPHRVTTRL